MRLRTTFHRAATAALLVIALVALAGCSAVSQGMARGAAAISGPEAIQGKLGHVDGPLTFVAATKSEIAHYEIATDGTDGKVYTAVIEDAAIVAELIKKGVSKHDPVSFAGVVIVPEETVEQTPSGSGMILFSTGVDPSPKPRIPGPIRIKITRFKLR